MFKHKLRYISINLLFIILSSSLWAQQVSNGPITLEWDDNSDNEEGFCVEQKINRMGEWQLLDSVDMNITQFGPLSYAPLDTYYFRVYAYNAIGNSGFTNILTVIFDSSIPNPPVITGMRSILQNQIQIEWLAIPEATGYNIYRSNEPYFEPDLLNRTNCIAENVQDIDPITPDIQWNDADQVAGDPDLNYFYVITSLNGDVEGMYSNRVGLFDFFLTTTTVTNFNEIALPLSIQGITNAQELMSRIPGCNAVARWDASMQGYEQYIPGIPPTNFSVEMGYPYYVNVNDDTVFSIMGEIVNPSFNLVTTSITNFNDIMLPLNKYNITKASELLADIPNCNSVAYWDADIQGYQQYIPGIPPTDFDVIAGYPYYVNVTSNIIWPENGGPAKSINNQEIADEWNNSQAPHVAWGRLDDFYDVVDSGNMGFSVSIDGRPNEVLTEDSPGCMIIKDYWIIQVGSFASPWKEGEVLRIVFEKDNRQMGEVYEIELTSYPADEVSVSTIERNDIQSIKYQLCQNYPNPFNSNTMIPYHLPENAPVTISIFNMMGQEIKKLVDEEKEKGNYMITWDGRGSQNSFVPSDVYIVRMEAGQYIENRKITFIK